MCEDPGTGLSSFQLPFINSAFILRVEFSSISELSSYLVLWHEISKQSSECLPNNTRSCHAWESNPHEGIITPQSLRTFQIHWVRPSRRVRPRPDTDVCAFLPVANHQRGISPFLDRTVSHSCEKHLSQQGQCPQITPPVLSKSKRAMHKVDMMAWCWFKKPRHVGTEPSEPADNDRKFSATTCPLACAHPRPAIIHADVPRSSDDSAQYTTLHGTQRPCALPSDHEDSSTVKPRWHSLGHERGGSVLLQFHKDLR